MGEYYDNLFNSVPSGYISESEPAHDRHNAHVDHNKDQVIRKMQLKIDSMQRSLSGKSARALSMLRSQPPPHLRAPPGPSPYDEESDKVQGYFDIDIHRTEKGYRVKMNFWKSVLFFVLFYLAVLLMTGVFYVLAKLIAQAMK